MVDISFNIAGQFKGIADGPNILSNPTSLQFGPDGRLYVSEQNGTINAFTVTLQDGEYIATAVEEINLVKAIQNHNDDGSLNDNTKRQITGIVTTGTAENPILYVSSSDPRISHNGEVNLDTNSGVITRLSWTGTSWDVVDIIRGLPRSEENHATNGMVLSPDGTKIYVAQGGNTNNGAPSSFFSNTAEYALSGTVLEIDLNDINSRSVLTDPIGAQGGTPRQYIYDLPTLDDPSVVNQGTRETIEGLDVAGPWGGNDGFNMSILPADAPLRIYAHGFRNHYDLVMTESGKLYTVDNGSNSGLGGNPILDDNGEATNQPNGGGSGNPEPLFLIEEGEYYGHPNPTLSNQDGSWTVYDDDGNPDALLSPNAVPSLADLVPDGINIQSGFVVDPSKFTADPDRLAETGIRVEYNSADSKALVTLGSSSNGLVEYTGNAFEGALQGALIVTQFNGNVTLLNLNEEGTDVAPLVTPGDDGILGTADDEIVDGDGVFPLISGFSQALDVTVGPDGTIWVAEIGADFIKAFAPSDLILPADPDFDNDGLFNTVDPFIRDATNGGSVLIFPGQTLNWDFDANQDNNLPGPDGYGGGLTGAMVNGTTDFEVFFQSPSTLPNQDVKLDNVKFITAAGGGTTVIENVSSGTPLASSNDGEYLFHTGVTIGPTIEAFKVKWSVFNPGNELTSASQQIGGYLGTGDQSNYLKIVASQDPSGEIRVSLENNDLNQSNTFLQANDLFTVSNPANKKIFFELAIDSVAETVTPTVTYQTDTGDQTVTGAAISLSGTAVLDAVKGNYTVQGQKSGLAVGLFSSNEGEPIENTFQAIFDGIEITADEGGSSTVLYRVNAGGSEVAAIDGGPNWSADTQATNSDFLSVPGSNNVVGFSVQPGATVAPTTPNGIFLSERWDADSNPEMQWAFDTPVSGQYEVRLFMGNGFEGTSSAGQRLFDVLLEGSVPAALDDIDLTAQFGHQVGGMISQVVEVTDGTLNLEFVHQLQNPLVNGIEIIQLGGSGPTEDNVSPTANLNQPLANITTETTAPQLIEVNFADNVDLDEATLDGDEIQVTDSTGNSLAVSFSGVVGTVATYQVVAPGGTWDTTDDDTYLVGAVAGSVSDVTGNAIASTPLGAFDVAISNAPSVGAATFSVTLNSNNVQISNFGNNSFQIDNVGDKKIAKVEFDVTNGLYPDSVFDPFGIAGDTVSKPLTINTSGGTGIVTPSNASYIGAGGTAGFEGIELVFDESVEGGFEPGENIGFSIDMDSNSIAGAQKSTLDSGTNPAWDVGGVSGAELIGSTVMLTFSDGTTASSQLQGAGNQGGAQTLASQDSPQLPISLSVNGLSAGSDGTYDANDPSVIVNGPAGQTARVVLTKGFIQPGTNNFTEPYKSQLDAQLASLAASTFPANNAVEFQTVDILLTGADQDISDQFDFSNVANFSFPGEDQLALGFVASAIDPGNANLPIGPVTQPIYLQFVETASSVAADSVASPAAAAGRLVDAVTGLDESALESTTDPDDSICSSGMMHSSALLPDSEACDSILVQNGDSLNRSNEPLVSTFVAGTSSTELTQLILGSKSDASGAVSISSEPIPLNDGGPLHKPVALSSTVLLS